MLLLCMVSARWPKENPNDANEGDNNREPSKSRKEGGKRGERGELQRPGKICLDEFLFAQPGYYLSFATLFFSAGGKGYPWAGTSYTLHDQVLRTKNVTEAMAPVESHVSTV